LHRQAPLGLPSFYLQVEGGANQIQRNANSREALGVEFGCTALLVIVVMAATDTHRAEANKHLLTIAPLVIGMAVTAAHFIAIPVDNCSINPARTFGVSVVSGNFNDHWVFWLGPMLGAAGAAILYKYVFRHPDAAAKDAADAAAAAKAEAEHVDEVPAPPPRAVTMTSTKLVPAAIASPAARRVTSSAGTGSITSGLHQSHASVSIEAAPVPLPATIETSEWR
jgi:hypothetical protein